MFTRIVKMKFKEDKILDFITHFKSVQDQVRNQPGCHTLILYQDKKNENIFFTYSIWDDLSDLDRYRKSDFFAEVWQETKQFFDGKPEAWSLDELVNI